MSPVGAGPPLEVGTRLMEAGSPAALTVGAVDLDADSIILLGDDGAARVHLSAAEFERRWTEGLLLPKRRKRMPAWLADDNRPPSKRKEGPGAAAAQGTAKESDADQVDEGEEPGSAESSGTRADTAEDVSAPPKKSSKYRGVSWNRVYKAWRAKLGFKGKVFYLGDHRVEVQAAMTRDLKLIDLKPPGSVRNEDLNLPLALYVRAACSGGTLALEGAPCGPPGEDGSGDDESPETLRLAYSVIEKMGMKGRLEALDIAGDGELADVKDDSDDEGMNQVVARGGRGRQRGRKAQGASGRGRAVLGAGRRADGKRGGGDAPPLPALPLFRPPSDGRRLRSASATVTAATSGSDASDAALQVYDLSPEAVIGTGRGGTATPADPVLTPLGHWSVGPAADVRVALRNSTLAPAVGRGLPDAEGIACGGAFSQVRAPVADGHGDASHGFMGVEWDEDRQLWGGHFIDKAGRRVSTGFCADAEDCARVRDYAALQKLGKHAQLNFPARESDSRLKTSAYLGVSRELKGDVVTWRARIKLPLDTADRVLGSFPVAKEAARAFDQAAMRQRGAGVAAANFPKRKLGGGVDALWAISRLALSVGDDIDSEDLPSVTGHSVWLFRGEMWMEGLLDGACCEGKWVVAFPDGTEVAMSAAELQVSPDVVIEGATVDALRRTCP